MLHIAGLVYREYLNFSNGSTEARVSSCSRSKTLLIILNNFIFNFKMDY